MTISKAASLLRSGASADWLEIKLGDTFVNQDFNGTICAQHGLSATQPFAIVGYGNGTTYWQIEVPASETVAALIYTGAGGCGAGGEFTFIADGDFYNYTADPSNGSYVANGHQIFGINHFNVFTWFVVENVKARFFLNDFDIDGQFQAHNTTGFQLRRSVLTDSYSAGNTGHSQCVYTQFTDNSTYYENAYDHCGWNALTGNAPPTIFNHLMYLQCDVNGGGGCNGPVTATGNFFSNDSSGTQFRSGGTIQYNAFGLSPYGSALGLPTGGQNTVMSYNVYQSQMDQTANATTVASSEELATFSTYNGQSFNLGTATISNNLFAHSSTPNTNGGAIIVDSGQLSGHITLLNNIACDWLVNNESVGNTLLIYDGNTATQGGSQQKASNCNSGSWTGSQPTLVDPNRTWASYCASLGSACAASANATFTGVIASGVLTISGISGTVSVGDAIIYAGQTQADFIKSFGTGSGGNGTYNLGGTESQGSISMSSYTNQQLVIAFRANNFWNWNGNLTGCAVAKYLQAGFGITNPCVP